MPDFRLKVFYAVATNLSFTKASAALFISQPAVTKNIQELEAEYALRLFDRKGNKIVLTQAGEILLSYTEKVMAIYRQIDFDLNIIKNKFSGQLKLGASTTIGQYILPPILAKFYQAFPDIQLSMMNDNTEKIENAILSKTIELGIVEGITHKNELKYIPFLKDELVAIVHTEQKLSQREELSLDELKEIPWVMRERGSGTLEVIENELGKHKIKLSDLNIAIYLGSSESIKSFLTYSNCVGFISIQAIGKEIANGEFKVIEIPDLNISRTFYFAHLQGNPDGLSENFMRFCKHYYN